MSIACIDTPQSHVRLHSERLEVHSPSRELVAVIPLADLERILLNEQAQITTQALAAALRKGIPVHFIDGLGREIGSAFSVNSSDARTRLLQYQAALNPDFGLEVARKIVRAKISNQRRIVQKLIANRPGRVGRKKLPVLARSYRSAESCLDLQQLRGTEGSATRRYFDLWARFLPGEFPFERRSARPPRNPVNACISYGSTLVYNDVTQAVRSAGLDPGLGFLHSTENGRWSLSLDLMEPFRPALVEALTMHLFGHQLLSGSDFEMKGAAVYLNAKGRRTFITHYEQRLERRFFHRRSDERGSLRSHFQRQAVSLKSAIAGHTLETFEPFRLD